MHLNAVVTKWDDETGRDTAGVNRVELTLDDANAKGFFARLESARGDIEEELGTPPSWHNPENTKQCRIYTKRSVNIENRGEWVDQFVWLRLQLERFREVLGPGVKALEVIPPE